ncbi:hypothetical protein UT300012_21880 [Paraclostridium bifermentans]
MKLERLGKDVLCVVHLINERDVSPIINDLGLSNFINQNGLCLACRFKNNGDFSFATLINDNSYEESDDRRIEYITLNREEIRSCELLEIHYNMILGFINQVLSEGIIVRDKMPKDLKIIIDNYYSKTLEASKYYLGSGRKVLLTDKYAIKFPEFIDDEETDGLKQNEFEEYITNLIESGNTFEKAKSIINRVIYSYRSVNVYKRINNDIDSLSLRFGFNNRVELEDYIVKAFSDRLTELSDSEDLHLEDALRATNWGYDEDTEEWKCLDYGLRMDY